MKLILSLLVLLSSMSTFAQRGRAFQEIPLHLDIQTQGVQTLKLKQLLNQQHRQIDASDLELVAVRIVAKSRAGRGEAVLVVGQNTSYPVTVQGSPYNFESYHHSTFFNIIINNPKQNDNGVWQLDLKGNLKIKRVDLIVAKMARARVQTIQLRMYEQHLVGQSTLRLKQLLNEQTYGLDLTDVELVKVSMLAKSKAGHGEAVLVVGQSSSYPTNIAGRPIAFESQAPRSYSYIEMLNPTRDSNGKWQIDFKGNIKVKDIVITIKTGGRAAPEVETRQPRAPRRRRG